MSDLDEQMLGNQKAKTITNLIWWVFLFLILGTVGGMYIYLNRSNRTPNITPDTCGAMCGENGVVKYDGNECECNPPKPPPQKTTLDKLDCTCTPMNTFQRRNSDNPVTPEAKQ